MTDSILNVPGLASMTPRFVYKLAAIADAHGWNADGIAGVISHESRFNAQARNPQPGQTATGLIQFIESTAQSLGTSTAALAQMTAEQQLPYVEKYFASTLGIHKPSRPESYILAPFGRADLSEAPDDYVIDRETGGSAAESERYRVNSALDAGHKGYITVGDLRRSMQGVLQSANGRIPVPKDLPGEVTPPAPSSSPSSQPVALFSRGDVVSDGDLRLRTLRVGARGPLVRVWQIMLGDEQSGIPGGWGFRRGYRNRHPTMAGKNGVAGRWDCRASFLE